MSTSLGIVRMLIHGLGQGSVADKPHTSRFPCMSVADITDCSNSSCVELHNLVQGEPGRHGGQLWPAHELFILSVQQGVEVHDLVQGEPGRHGRSLQPAHVKFPQIKKLAYV